MAVTAGNPFGPNVSPDAQEQLDASCPHQVW
jgi:hypothetical protein